MPKDGEPDDCAQHTAAERGVHAGRPGADPPDPHGPGGCLLSHSSVTGLRGWLNLSNPHEAKARNQLLFSRVVSLKKSQLLTNTNQNT